MNQDNQQKYTEMESLIDNYINGNLTDAKAQAERFHTAAIRKGFMEIAGYSFRKATLTAEWLTGQTDSRQAACDAD